MQRHPVSSTDLQSVGYDLSTHTLEIEFRGGGVYRYAGVPEHIYQGLMAAGSKGTYFHSHIKERYPYTRV